MPLNKARRKYREIVLRMASEVDLLIALGHPVDDEFSASSRRSKILDNIREASQELLDLLDTPVEKIT